MPTHAAEAAGLDIKPVNILGDFVLRSGKRVVEVITHLHENPDILDRFEQIGLLPESRQPLAVERELGMLFGALQALHKVKASATTDKPEPDTAPARPRAEPPPPSVQGSPHIVEPDLSKVEDFGEYMAKKGYKAPR